MPRINMDAIRYLSCRAPEDTRGTRITEGPQPAFICEAVTIGPYDELPYCFELQKGETLEFTFRSDVPVDVLLCNTGDYDRWLDSGYDPEIGLLVYLEAEDVYTYSVRFTAPDADEYTVLLMNWTEGTADLAIEIPDSMAAVLR